MPYTQDWSRTRPHWDELFRGMGMAGQPDLCFLEIGCYEGLATMWLLQHVLTHSTSRMHVVDTFLGSEEFEPMGIFPDSYERFTKNISAYAHRVEVHVGRSEDKLREFRPVETFDFIYIDGSHKAKDVLTDAVLCWPLLKKGRPMVFDDLRWAPPGHTYTAQDVPSTGIQAFLSAFASEIDWGIDTTDQLTIKKKR